MRGRTIRACQTPPPTPEEFWMMGECRLVSTHPGRTEAVLNPQTGTMVSRQLFMWDWRQAVDMLKFGHLRQGGLTAIKRW